MTVTVFVYLECTLLIGREDTKADAQEAVHHSCPLTGHRGPSDTKPHVTGGLEGRGSVS